MPFTGTASPPPLDDRARLVGQFEEAMRTSNWSAAEALRQRIWEYDMSHPQWMNFQQTDAGVSGTWQSPPLRPFRQPVSSYPRLRDNPEFAEYYWAIHNHRAIWSHNKQGEEVVVDRSTGKEIPQYAKWAEHENGLKNFFCDKCGHRHCVGSDESGHNIQHECSLLLPDKTSPNTGMVVERGGRCNCRRTVRTRT